MTKRGYGVTNIEKDQKIKLAHRLKGMIIERLELEDITPEDVSNDDSIFGAGLNLDSLDALDLVLLLEKEFNIRITDPEQAKKILSTINTLAEYILNHGSGEVDKDRQ